MLKDFSQESFWVELEAKRSHVFEKNLVDLSEWIDELVGWVTPLPEILELNEHVQDELELFYRDRVVK